MSGGPCRHPHAGVPLICEENGPFHHIFLPSIEVQVRNFQKKMTFVASSLCQLSVLKWVPRWASGNVVHGSWNLLSKKMTALCGRSPSCVPSRSGARCPQPGPRVEPVNTQAVASEARPHVESRNHSKMPILPRDSPPLLSVYVVCAFCTFFF